MKNQKGDCQAKAAAGERHRDMNELVCWMMMGEGGRSLTEDRRNEQGSHHTKPRSFCQRVWALFCVRWGPLTVSKYSLLLIGIFRRGSLVGIVRAEKIEVNKRGSRKTYQETASGHHAREKGMEKIDTFKVIKNYLLIFNIFIFVISLNICPLSKCLST